ncbi:MAG TPA: HAMP domain-containing sensor histidine kinase [Nocardioidaceae bacterium]|nr:HAMP domain-containing sensor histidine kinase [Nocardioidaceae bacterium]
MAERRRARGSVRTRTTLLATVVSGTALLLGAVLLLATLDRSLHRAGDDLARSRVQDLSRLAAESALPRVLAGIGGEGVGQVFDSRGTVLAASPNIVGRPPVSTFTSTDRGPVVRILRNAPDDRETETYRVWVSTASTPRGPVTVLAGSSLESVGEASRALGRDLAVGVPLLVLLVAGGTWLLVGRTLRPVEDIRAEVAAISEEDLERRVPVPDSGDEVSRLAVTMNLMLDRLEAGNRRQREFVADASHELQSPITALRTQIEVALAHPGDDWPELAQRLLRDTDEMERLVRDLLFLARASGDAPAHPTRLVDLDDIVLEEAGRLRSRTTAVLDTAAVSAAPVLGHPDDLRRLVRNVLENAVRHARSAISVCLVGDAARTRLDIVDDGPGVAARDRDRVFDRFYTSDTSRSRGHGNGLGLAIADAIAVRHGGCLELVDDDAGAHFALTLPSATGAHVASTTSR